MSPLFLSLLTWAETLLLERTPSSLPCLPAGGLDSPSHIVVGYVPLYGGVGLRTKIIGNNGVG